MFLHGSSNHALMSIYFTLCLILSLQEEEYHALDENEACARWDFVRGEFVERLNEFIKARVHPERLGAKNPPVVPYELVKEFRNLVGEANCFGVWQRPGALVEVPSTMAHQVTNLKPNIKIAWDYVDAAYLLRGVRAQHLISKMWVVRLQTIMCPCILCCKCFLQS